MDQRIEMDCDFDVARRALEGLRDRDGGSVTTLGVRVSYGITGAADMGPGGVGWKVGELVTQDLDAAVAEVVRVARHRSVAEAYDKRRSPVEARPRAPVPPPTPEPPPDLIGIVRSWVARLRARAPRLVVASVSVTTKAGIRSGLVPAWTLEQLDGELALTLGRVVVRFGAL